MKKILITIAMVFTLLVVGCDNSPSGPVDWADGKTYAGPVTQVYSGMDGTYTYTYTAYVSFTDDDFAIGESLDNMKSLRQSYTQAKWSLSKTEDTWKLHAPEFQIDFDYPQIQMVGKYAFDITATKQDERSINLVYSFSVNEETTTNTGNNHSQSTTVTTGTLVLVEE